MSSINYVYVVLREYRTYAGKAYPYQRNACDTHLVTVQTTVDSVHARLEDAVRYLNANRYVKLTCAQGTEHYILDYDCEKYPHGYDCNYVWIQETPEATSPTVPGLPLDGTKRVMTLTIHRQVLS